MTWIILSDLKEFITNAICEVFDTMLSMDMEIVEGASLANQNGSRIVGSIGFAGFVLGNLNLHVEEFFPA